jgi:hypothetical protein
LALASYVAGCVTDRLWPPFIAATLSITQRVKRRQAAAGHMAGADQVNRYRARLTKPHVFQSGTRELFLSPEALAAANFHYLPVTIGHHGRDLPSEVIGTTCADMAFNGTYVEGTIALWNIAPLLDGHALSLGFDKHVEDSVVTAILPHHVALGERSAVGPDIGIVEEIRS